MKNREILKAVLEKGIDNGYKVNQASFDYLMNLLRKDDETCRSELDYYINENKYYDTIFSHEFAKAFWGDELLSDGQTKEQIINGFKKFINSDPLDIKMSNKEIERSFIQGKYYFIVPNWQHHLEKMVLKREPLKYMEKFLK